MEYVWTNNNCLNLIAEYERHPVLWKVDHASYYCKEKRIEAWITIAADLDVDIDEVKYKMNNLLGGFRREKNKKSTIFTGFGPKEVYSSRWFAFKPMKFLLKESNDAEFLQRPEFASHRSKSLSPSSRTSNKVKS